MQTDFDQDFRRLAARGSFVIRPLTQYASVRDELPYPQEERFRRVVALDWWPLGHRCDPMTRQRFISASVAAVLVLALESTAPPRVPLGQPAPQLRQRRDIIG